MKSGRHGENTSDPEVTNVSRFGFWLLVDGRERYLPFDEFPWFRQATIEQLTTVERPRTGHLRWPKLDIDLTLDSIDRPEAYPLVSRAVRDRADKVSNDPE